MALALVLNGRQREFDGLGEGDSLGQLILELGLKGDRIAVEKNGEIVTRDSWGSVALRAGDRLEVVHFVGGGSPSTLGCSAANTTIQNICYRT